MKIVFEDGITYHSYEVKRVEYQHDEDGKPIDIVIYGSKSILEAIAENHGMLGFNMQRVDSWTTDRLGWGFFTYEALYARLDDFKVISNCKTTHE